jgi:putative ABC transport system substrate-binding protein
MSVHYNKRHARCPIVFVQVTDSVGSGFVASLAHPGGNATGFTVFEFDIGAKWLELLKQVSRSVSRVAVLRDPANPSGTGFFGAIQTVAPTFGVEASPIGLHDAGEIERGVGAFATGPKGGLVVTPSGLAIANRGAITKLAARYQLPAIYPFRDFVVGGGLLSYGPDGADQYRRAAGYADRILSRSMTMLRPSTNPISRNP